MNALLSISVMVSLLSISARVKVERLEAATFESLAISSLSFGFSDNGNHMITC